jgi:chemotaxis methyl-accepting protein methylase
MKEKTRQVTDLLLRLQGIDVSKYDDSFLNQSLQKRITETQCDTVGDYCSFLEQHEEEVMRLINSLHISYSGFFRNSLTFAVLEHIVLPSVVLKRKNVKHKEIRIWTAACAAGQESYSLAMLMEEFNNGSGPNIEYRIFATDQNELQVNEAEKGCYSSEALYNLSLRRAERWFHNQADTCSVKQELKSNIDFSVFDLLDERYSSPPVSIYGEFDVVVCANLLFYYKPGYRKKIIEKACNSLAPGGYLVTGETERTILMHHNFREIIPQSAIFQINT